MLEKKLLRMIMQEWNGGEDLLPDISFVKPMMLRGVCMDIPVNMKSRPANIIPVIIEYIIEPKRLLMSYLSNRLQNIINR